MIVMIKTIIIAFKGAIRNSWTISSLRGQFEIFDNILTSAPEADAFTTRTN